MIKFQRAINKKENYPILINELLRSYILKDIGINIEKLSKVMKNSNSLINVFRFGIGDSFDMYEQYKYLFPLSDKYCGSVSNQNAFIDRYTNYLQPSFEEYNPSNMPETIPNSSSIPEPLKFSDSALINPNILASISLPNDDGTTTDLAFYWKHFNKDAVGYFQKYYASVAQQADGMNYFLSGYSKDFDKSFYSKMLTSTYYSYIYGDNNLSRAPFECAIGYGECYSGVCDSSFYNRALLLSDTGKELNADCFYDSNNGNKMLICSAIKSVSLSQTDPKVPLQHYGKVSLKPIQLILETTSYDKTKLQQYLSSGFGGPSGNSGTDEDILIRVFDEKWKGFTNQRGASFLGGRKWVEKRK